MWVSCQVASISGCLRLSVANTLNYLKLSLLSDDEKTISTISIRRLGAPHRDKNPLSSQIWDDSFFLDFHNKNKLHTTTPTHAKTTEIKQCESINTFINVTKCYYECLWAQELKQRSLFVFSGCIAVWLRISTRKKSNFLHVDREERLIE